MNKKGFSAGLVPFFPCGDRFLPAGYRKDNLSLEEKLDRISKVEDLVAVELDYPTDFEDPVKMNTMLERVGLLASNVEIDLFGDTKWKYGSLSSLNGKTRREAIDIARGGMEAASGIGCGQISLWLGQDGFDYAMQADYQEYWDNTTEAIKEIGEYRKDIRVAIEYKLKEPRTHIQIGTVGKALSLCMEVNLPNVGIMIDFGHALMAYENPAESAVLSARHNKLFHVHLNDNFRYWDDDLIIGSVHLWETLEFLYWLKKLNYSGWYSLDIFPYREDSIGVIEESILNLKILKTLAESLDQNEVAKLQHSYDATKMIGFLRKEILEKKRDL